MSVDWFHSLKIEKKLGSGGFAKVYLAVDDDGDNYAIKTIPKKLRQESNIKREVKAGSRLRNSPNLVKFIEHYEDDNYDFLVFNFAQGVNLCDFMEFRDLEPLSEKQVVPILKQLVDAVSFCHNLNTVHLDIKLDNIMYDPSSGKLQLVDFGLCDFITEENNGYFSRQCGSEEYAPPEVLLMSEKKFKGTKVDIWCMGVVIFALLTGFFPFHVTDRMESVTNGEPLPELIFPSNISSNCRDLLRKMMENSPKKRATMDDIKNHVFCK